jgi:D-alanyl-lipoteichoic acid acyltransferase DltB (MBOAT superfamily)
VLFNTLAYAQFFAIAFVVSWLLSRWGRLRLLFLLGASYAFYAHWDYRFLPLIWASSTADYLLARRIHVAKTQGQRKRWLIGTVVLNLGVLGFFKYFDFGLDSARLAATALGLDVPDVALSVALPVGISFFTFESMSYVIDVYRRQLEPHKNYFEYLTFVAFFPHLVAGPIVRPRDLLPQLAAKPKWNPKEGSEGLFSIALGLCKKVIVGDYLALNLVDRVFDAPLMYSALETYAAVVGYALQIYCDFSGYTDIAIGSALLLGVRFPLNFDSPYKARSIVEFWRRWHISLSTWLRDYLYVPLGGNRKGPARTYLNLLITMVLGGLWHGAAWTFVAWGALHGAALALNKWWSESLAPRLFGERKPSPLAKLALGLLTFHFVCGAWIFFRAASFDQARLVFSRLGTLTTYHPNLSPSVLGILALGIVGHLVPDAWFSRLRERFVSAPGLAQGLVLFAAAVALRHMASSESVPFVYFQF